MIRESSLQVSSIGLFSKVVLEFRYLIDGIELYLTDNQSVVEFFLQGVNFCDLLNDERQASANTGLVNREKMKYLDESSSEEADKESLEFEARPVRPPSRPKLAAAPQRDRPEDIYTDYTPDSDPNHRFRTPFDD